ncbi:hypothetical protein QMK38_13045 [Lysinibacillus fusiformis]|nr:hypothetical protein [Lysinibacillus fusiformis]
MKKIVSIILIYCIVFYQTLTYASVIIEIPDITPDLQSPIIDNISLSSSELIPATPIKVIAEISDELSGFKNGSITYLKPNGQLTSNIPFTLNSTTGKYEATISVSEIDIAGEWKVYNIYLEDNKGNSTYLNSNSNQIDGDLIDFSNLNINVTGVTAPLISSDKTPPVLSSISVSSQEVEVNEEIIVKANITDNDSGVASVYMRYTKPSGATKIIYLYKNTLGQYEGVFKIGKYEESGQWTANSVYLSDKNGNSQTITNYIDENKNNKGLEHCIVNISGTVIDSEAPILRNINVKSQQVKANEKIEVIADVTDNESGVTSVRVTYSKPDGSSQVIYLYKNTEGKFVGNITINQYEERGLRTLKSVYLSDAVGNSTTIMNYVDVDGITKNFDNCTIEVVGTTPDGEGPEFTYGNISLQQISSIQAAVKLEIEVEDSLSGIANSTLTGTYKKPMSGKLLQLKFIKENNKYTSTILIDRYDEIGEWVLTNLTIKDAVGNYNKIYKIGGHSFSEFSIFVSSGNITITPGTPNSIWFEVPERFESGQSYQLNPFLKFSNNNKEDIDITNDPITKYSTSNSELLTVNSNGLITIPNEADSGYVILEISYGNIARQVNIKINDGSIESYLQVSPIITTLHNGQFEQLKVVEVDDGARKDVTSSSSGIKYISDNPSLITVTKDGLIQATSNDIYGEAKILIDYNGKLSNIFVKVTKPEVKNLLISPSEEVLLPKDKIQLIVKAIMSDGTTKDVTAGSEGTQYISNSPSRAMVDTEGKVTIPENAPVGNVTITAKNGTQTATTVITIEEDPAKVVQSFEITPGILTMKPKEIQQLKVIAVMGDGNETELTAASTGTQYISNSPSRAMVDTEGKVTIPENAPVGNVTITAKNGTQTATTVITIEEDPAKVVQSFEITPGILTMKPKEIQQLKVIAVMGDGNETELTAASTGTQYISNSPSRAMVDTEGKVTIPENAPVGNVTITAKNGTQTATTVITVIENPSTVIKSLTVTPETVILNRGDIIDLKVAAIMEDGSEKNYTSSNNGTVYLSNSPSRATVNAEGKVTIAENAPLGNVTIVIKNGTIRTTVVIRVQPVI